MKRTVISTMFAILAFSAISLPVSAFQLPIKGIYYNFDAAPNEPALIIDWSKMNKPDSMFMGDQFALGGNIKSIADLEQSIEDEIALVILKKENINSYPEDDPIRQGILPYYCERVGNQIYTHISYFDIHIYSLDDPETPQSELRFITKFSKYPIPDDWWPVE